jgi:hypothetical protein
MVIVEKREISVSVENRTRFADRPAHSLVTILRLLGKHLRYEQVQEVRGAYFCFGYFCFC